MASSIKVRPNHYALLGLTPGASNDEIARAYARSVGVFGSRPFADVAEASIAFETLRDPARRRAYDQSLGIDPPAPPRVMAIAGRARFIAVAPGGREEPALHTLPAAASPPRPPSEARTASFIAASLRQPAEHSPPRAAQTRPEPPPEPARDLRLTDAGDVPVQWARPAAAAGGLVAAVIALGALIGWQASKGEDAQAQSAVTAPLPKAKPASRLTAPIAAAATLRVPELEPRRAAPVAGAAAKRSRPKSAPQWAALEAVPSQPAAAGESRLADLEIGAPASDAAPAEIAAAMPLSNATIARTIERIGYACGKVASTAPAEGGTPGVYTVTCTSGQSYRAAPVRGRYRFRRLGSH